MPPGIPGQALRWRHVPTDPTAMTAFLAISGAPGDVSPISDAHLQRALAYLPGTTANRTNDGWIAAPPPPVLADVARFTIPLTRSVRAPHGDVDAATLARMLGTGLDPVDTTALAALLPPFAAAHRAGADQPVVVAVDWLGLRQVYWWQADRVAAVSTSALALAALTGYGLHRPAVGLQSLMGWQVGLGTIFSGVHKLAPGSVARLHHGRISVHRYDNDGYADDSPARLDEAIGRMGDVLRDLLAAYLADHPDTVLQLSGGQDSRLLLCAIPPELRPGLRAVTLDLRGGAESAVAARLSGICRLDHSVHWLDDQAPLSPADAHRAAVDASKALDCMASPVALAPLMLAERHLEQGHRLAGTGGETARGFYYPGQPHAARTSARLIERLADWRLFTNEAAQAAALDPDFLAIARADALEQLQRSFDGYSSDWLRATDEFYLFERVQRWAGAHSTPAAVRRYSVNPLLDRSYLRLALSVPPRYKRNSRLTGALMTRLDARLAGVRLDSGLVPATLGRGGPLASASTAGVTVRKVVRKVRQRTRGGRPAQLGASGLAQLVVRHWRGSPDAIASLRTVDGIRQGWLDELLDGRRTTDPATVAFLVNVLVAEEAVRAPAPLPAPG